jgi:hypothetical protein
VCECGEAEMDGRGDVRGISELWTDRRFHPGTGTVANGRPFSSAVEREVPSGPWELADRSISLWQTVVLAGCCQSAPARAPLVRTRQRRGGQPVP